MQNKRNGITLVELLVVISIIGVLVSLLMPGLGKARAYANRTGCAANLKQIDVAMHLYLGANEETYPSAEDPVSKIVSKEPNDYYWLWMGRGWRKFVEPYLGGHIDANNPSVLLCPQDRVSPQKYESTSYSYSMAFYHSPEQIDEINSIQQTYLSQHIKPSAPQKVMNVARPAEKILIGEWLSNHQRIKEGADPGWWGWAGSRNFLFADGQVRFLKAQDIRKANDGNPNPNVTVGGIKGSDWRE
jgi:prepilin-type N-terminal cleavage/methylation domain-containing protein/prepilin-type processing-associated H-X9-DG protein